MRKPKFETPDLTSENIGKNCRSVPELRHRSVGRTRRDQAGNQF